MRRRFTTKIKEWIIHKLGGITEQEIPAKTKIQVSCKNVWPQHVYFLHDYTANGYDDKNVIEKHAKQEALLKLATELDRAGYVQYTMSDINDVYDQRVYTVHRSIMADIWVVKIP